MNKEVRDKLFELQMKLAMNQGRLPKDKVDEIKKQLRDYEREAKRMLISEYERGGKAK